MFHEPKIIYVCDHDVYKKTDEVKIIELTKSSFDYDPIVEEGIVVESYSVYQFIDNAGEEEFKYYYEGVDYNISENKMNIEWLTTNKPNNGDTFYIECMHSIAKITAYNQDECVRCNGNGWYVSLLSVRKKTVGKLYGLDKLVQEIIKILLTFKYYDYGSELLGITGENSDDEEVLSNEVRRMIKDCEDQYKDLQNTDILSYNMSDDERLDSLEVTNITFDYDSGGIYISLLLTNESRAASQINLLV